MAHSNNLIYITCTRHKSLQRKHIAVCRQCQWNADCEPYQEYCSSKSPSKSKEPSQTVTPRLIPEDLAGYIKSELGEIRTLLENQIEVQRKAPLLLKKNSSFQDDVLEFIKEELREIRTLC